MKSSKKVTNKSQIEAINEILALKVLQAMRIQDTKESVLSKYDIIVIAGKTEEAMLSDGEVSSHLCDFDAELVERALTAAIIKNDNRRNEEEIKYKVPSINYLMTELSDNYMMRKLIEDYNNTKWSNTDER